MRKSTKYILPLYLFTYFDKSKYKLVVLTCSFIKYLSFVETATSITCINGTMIEGEPKPTTSVSFYCRLITQALSYFHDTYLAM